MNSNHPEPVLVPPADSSARDQLVDLAREAQLASRDDDPVASALRLAASWGPRLPRPAGGATAGLWSALASLGAVDLTVARVVEPHLDALGILAQAHFEGPDRPAEATWGVYAAEAPGERLTAIPHGNEWELSGHKPWCSLADRVSHALVTAWVDDTNRGLFAVNLRAQGVRLRDSQGGWVGHGLPRIRSGGLDFDGVRAGAVGQPGWYLSRPGFAWGGVGVAAVWFGGAVSLARRVVAHASSRTPDQVAQLHVGQLDLALTAARAALAEAARRADAGPGAVTGPSESLVAVRTRSLVADTVDTVIRVADHAMGPGPLAREAEHAQRVSDLRLYVRQHHAERDVADLGRHVLDRAGQLPW